MFAANNHGQFYLYFSNLRKSDGTLYLQTFMRRALPVRGEGSGGQRCCWRQQELAQLTGGARPPPCSTDGLGFSTMSSGYSRADVIV